MIDVKIWCIILFVIACFWSGITSSIDTWKNDLAPITAFKRIPHSFILDFSK